MEGVVRNQRIEEEMTIAGPDVGNEGSEGGRKSRVRGRWDNKAKMVGTSRRTTGEPLLALAQTGIANQ